MKDSFYHANRSPILTESGEHQLYMYGWANSPEGLPEFTDSLRISWHHGRFSRLNDIIGNEHTEFIKLEEDDKHVRIEPDIEEGYDPGFTFVVSTDGLLTSYQALSSLVNIDPLMYFTTGQNKPFSVILECNIVGKTVLFERFYRFGSVSTRVIHSDNALLLDQEIEKSDDFETIVEALRTQTNPGRSDEAKCLFEMVKSWLFSGECIDTSNQVRLRGYFNDIIDGFNNPHCMYENMWEDSDYADHDLLDLLRAMGSIRPNTISKAFFFDYLVNWESGTAYAPGHLITLTILIRHLMFDGYHIAGGL